MRGRAAIAAILLAVGTGCALSDAMPVAEVPVEGAVPIRDRYARGRLVMLAEVNEDRAAADAPPVTLDSLATVVAQSHAETMARGGYLSHYQRDGSGPHQRFARAGGTAHVRENVFRWTPRPENPRREVYGWRWFDIRRAETWFMGSPPHRATILDPSRTHVGIGIAEDEEGAIYVVQEFLARRATIEEVGTPWRGASTLVRGSVVRPGTRPFLVYLSPVEETAGDPTFVPPAGPYSDGEPGGVIVPPWAIGWDPATGSFVVSVGTGALDETTRWYGIVYVASEEVVERAVEAGVVNSNAGMPGAAFFVDGS